MLTLRLGFGCESSNSLLFSFSTLTLRLGLGCESDNKCNCGKYSGKAHRDREAAGPACGQIRFLASLGFFLQCRIEDGSAFGSFTGIGFSAFFGLPFRLSTTQERRFGLALLRFRLFALLAETALVPAVADDARQNIMCEFHPAGAVAVLIGEELAVDQFIEDGLGDIRAGERIIEGATVAITGRREKLVLDKGLHARRKVLNGPEVEVLENVLLFDVEEIGGDFRIRSACVLNDAISARSLGRAGGVKVHAVFAGPVDTDMTRSLNIPKASPEAVAHVIFDGVEEGEEDIFPDPMSEGIAEGWRSGVAKTLERQFAAYLPEGITKVA